MDGVRDYCALLGAALERLGTTITVEHATRDREFWPAALWRLWRRSRSWRDLRVVMQYTAFSWSRWGVPLLFLIAAFSLRVRGVKVAIAYHDAVPQAGRGLTGLLRSLGQRFVMRCSYRLADRAILTIPTAAATWLPHTRHAVTIPAGSNIVSAEFLPEPRRRPPESRVVVFGVTGGPSASTEVAVIREVIHAVSVREPHVELVLFGSGTEQSALELKHQLRSVPVTVEGVVPAEVGLKTLESARALLFVRGAVTGGRTTAIAGVVAGTPVVGFESALTSQHLLDAGVRLVRPEAPADLAVALREVLCDERVWQELHGRSLVAAREHFSWPAIARAYVDALGL